jgi:hypothetical protein
MLPYSTCKYTSWDKGRYRVKDNKRKRKYTYFVKNKRG